jgi:hypothetical protein
MPARLLEGEEGRGGSCAGQTAALPAGAMAEHACSGGSVPCQYASMPAAVAASAGAGCGVATSATHARGRRGAQ